ncbi:MAG: acyl-CoA thioesterase [Solirubrobacteraceae bacterium]
MAAFRHTLRVRFQECDPQGVVYFARYPEYYDIAITELFRTALGSYQSMVDSGTDMVVAEQTVRYRAPARFDELVDVDIAIDRLGDTSMISTYTITRDGTLLVEGDFRHVFIEVATKAKKPIPGDIRAALAGYAPADGAA